LLAEPTLQFFPCCSVDSIFEAKKLASDLGFEHDILDIRDYFETTVIQNFISEYLNGRTPNPCVVCNEYIKWNKMIEEADKLGCEFLATGHYAKIIKEKNRFFIRKGNDITKDQSYFLWNLTQENLARTIFPLGELTKIQVREIAKQHNYDKIATKRESQEICFIPNDDYKDFLRKNNVRFSDIDISKDQVAAKDMIKKSGQQGVPQLWINNVPIVGFDKEKIKKILAK